MNAGHVLGASRFHTMLLGTSAGDMGRIIGWTITIASGKLSNIAMIIFEFFAGVANWFQSVADESSTLLPFIMPCWPGGSDYGPPEFEIEDTSSRRRGTTKIKSSLRVKNFIKSTTRHHDCTVCLSEFAENDIVYELPQCKHIFHKPCLNEWLQHSRTTCPLCRSSLQPPEAHDQTTVDMSANFDHDVAHRYN